MLKRKITFDISCSSAVGRSGLWLTVGTQDWRAYDLIIHSHLKASWTSLMKMCVAMIFHVSKSKQVEPAWWRCVWLWFSMSQSQSKISQLDEDVCGYDFPCLKARSASLMKMCVAMIFHVSKQDQPAWWRCVWLWFSMSQSKLSQLDEDMWGYDFPCLKARSASLMKMYVAMIFHVSKQDQPAWWRCVWLWLSMSQSKLSQPDTCVWQRFSPFQSRLNQSDIGKVFKLEFRLVREWLYLVHGPNCSAFVEMDWNALFTAN